MHAARRLLGGALLASHLSLREVSTCASAAVSSAHSMKIGYVTDVEGNLEYFREYVQLSPVLEYDASDDLQFVDDSCIFVFGGDVVDKGAGDIRLCRQLVSLKRRYPDRVALLVGNRDLNKIRYTAELSTEDMARPVADIPRPHWDPNAPSLLEHLQSVAQETGRAVNEVNTRFERLRYMHLHTLGCPNTIAFRREELAALSQRTTEDVSDEEVLESCIHEIASERGSLRQYLHHGCVAAVFGNTLFVHGALDRHTMQFVPAENTRFELPEANPNPCSVPR